jgi:hypothetical protein
VLLQDLIRSTSVILRTLEEAVAIVWRLEYADTSSAFPYTNNRTDRRQERHKSHGQGRIDTVSIIANPDPWVS